MLDILLDALVKIDELYLKLNPLTPHLYESGVRYYHLGEKEEWLSIPECMHEKIADCKSLCPWLVAYYHVSGIDRGASCTKRYARVPGIAGREILLYHIQVQRSDGTIEDPSRQLGMGANEPDGFIPMPGVPWEVLHGVTNLVGAAMLESECGQVGAATGQLRRLAEHAQAGDARARYIVDIARALRNAGYSPHRTKWSRLPDGSWAWLKPEDAK